jgi:hypothetical protein
MHLVNTLELSVTARWTVVGNLVLAHGDAARCRQCHSGYEASSFNGYIHTRILPVPSTSSSHTTSSSAIRLVRHKVLQTDEDSPSLSCP